MLDPIGGTKSFISGMPVWGTLIGLTVKGHACYGLMHQPFTRERFSGDGLSALWRGLGANGQATERKLRTRACESLPGGNTRTGMYYAPFPLAMARGEGAYMWDLAGHKYRDYAGDFSAGLYGHTPAVTPAPVRPVLAGFCRQPPPFHPVPAEVGVPSPYGACASSPS